ncbi:MAG: metallophosphoesterase family protein [Pseudomonadota bacterium]
MTPDRFDHVREIAVMADCHIHPGDGIDWPPAVLDALAGVDLIVTVGDMGEAAGIAALSSIAPVMGVRGADDEDDPRTAPRARVVEAGGVRIGCVFDAVGAGLATVRDPIAPADGVATAEARLFGGPVAVVLHASTHAPSIEEAAGRLWVNPGSATLPADKGAGAFARLTVGAGAAEARIVRV